MKKFFLLLFIVSISIGMIIGIRNAINERNKTEIIDDEDSGDNYVHSLNIPLIEIDTLNPLLTKNKYVSNVLDLIYEPLVTISKDESIEPVLATEWAKKDDLNWIIKLRKNVKWHNGNELTATDVVFTINLLQLNEVNSIYKSNILNISNIEIIDDYSIGISLFEKDDSFMYKMIFPIIPEYYFRNGGIFDENKNNVPVGTGAFKYETNNLIEDYILLINNDDWWNTSTISRLKEIYLKKYNTYGEAIKAYKSAEIDLINTSMSDWIKKFGTIGSNIYSYESSTFDTIIPNTKNTILSDNSVRKAILYAINRDNIVSNVFNSNAIISDLPIHNSSKNYYSNIQSEYDSDKAKQILLNAGWKNNGKYWYKNGQSLKFTLLVNENSSELLKVAENIKENLSEININLTIKKVSWDNLIKSISEDKFELALMSLDIKNETTIAEMVKTNGKFNYANFENEQTDEIINDLNNNFDENGMYKLEKFYKDQTPYIGLYFRVNTLLTNKSVKGAIDPFWNNPFHNITSWCK